MRPLFLAMTLAAYMFSTEPRFAASASPDSRPFNPNFIIDDLELLSPEALSAAAIQRFLEAKLGTLATYKTKDVDGLERRASDIIAGAAMRNGISPKFLLVLLQKEQSLIEDVSPAEHQYDWATGYAVCDSCRTDDPALQSFRGFATQIEKAAARQRYYIEHPTEFVIRAGHPYAIDGQFVIPQNQATANMYIYTPHLHGNENFWNIWQRYFARHYPDGAILADETTQEVWLLQNGLRRQFISRSTVYADYDAKKILRASHADVQRYDIGLPIKFPEYSLLRSPRGTIYLLVADTRRGIASREVFRSLGFNPEEIIDVSSDDLNAYAEGAPIREAAANPVGQLQQDLSTGGVWYVDEGIRHPIWSRDILKSAFPHDLIKPAKAEALARYPIGKPVGFREGELVTAAGDSTVYVVSNGLKRRIASADVFTSLGYQWTNIIHTTARVLEVHADGPVVTL